jgi:XTP/dITP diphosphohydrolase
MKLVIATNNKNKIIEIKNKFASIDGLKLIPLGEFPGAPEVVEDGDTFRENAHKKALETSKFTGYPSMADDSGLVVDALGGRPGIFSARYGGSSADDTGRNRKLLGEMKGVPTGLRSARFVCIIAIVVPGGGSYFAEGTCEGVIAETMSGEHGFGYDPIFYLPAIGKTMAELTLDEKNRISHRAKALDEAGKILMTLSGRQEAP